MNTDPPVPADLPTREGLRRWPPDGYLLVNGAVDVRRKVACTCTERCGECHGDCGCAACELGWLVYQDDQVLWDESGNLINAADRGAAWKRIADPRQLRLRFQGTDMEPPHEGGKATGDEGGAGQPTPPDATAHDHPSVPPIYHDDTAIGSDPEKVRFGR